MPGGDKTGPDGQGPMTGRKMGYCAGYSNIHPGMNNGTNGCKKRKHTGNYNTEYGRGSCIEHARDSGNRRCTGKGKFNLRRRIH
ncbi:MAG: DUF5320 domain-containing protein [Bacteroidales bacterium]|nr:MAG: DUF5320 domain-containing protein [Bacteroidales bacterium]